MLRHCPSAGILITTDPFLFPPLFSQACKLGLQLLRVVPLVLFLIKSRFAGTERAKYRLWSQQEFTFGDEVANHTIILLLGLAYCCLAPLVAPFCLLYFALALLSQKYQLVYVMTVQYDATGRMWMNVSKTWGGGGAEPPSTIAGGCGGGGGGAAPTAKAGGAGGGSRRERAGGQGLPNEKGSKVLFITQQWVGLGAVGRLRDG